MASQPADDETEYEPQQIPTFRAHAKARKAPAAEETRVFQGVSVPRQAGDAQAADASPQDDPQPASDDWRAPDIEARPARATADRQVIDDAAMKDLMRDERLDGIDDILDEYWYSLATIALIVVNVVVFAVEFVLSGFSPDISSEVLVSMGAMYAPLIDSPADLYRFITPMFLHMGPLHLLMNMVALYSVGETLEYVLGKANFLLLYFVSGITGNAVSYAADVLIGTGHTVSAGASTSVFGLFVAVALLALLARGDRREILEYSKGMLAVIGVNLVYTLLVPGISVSGHLGGAVGGLIAMFMLPCRNLRVSNPVRAVVAVAWVAAVAWVVALTGVLG